MRRAFTLIEVTLSLGVLAGGILTVVGLYGLGYRESNQSREDVAATATADYVLGQLAAATVATTNWTAFSSIKNYPENKWVDYINDNTGRVRDNPTSIASDAFGDFIKALGVSGSFKFPGESFAAMKLKYGLVILHDDNSPVVRFAFRATRQPQLLMAAPMFYTEARFQGVSK